jgi:branched-chain amino acid transport system ATP-binding protein
MALLDVHDVTVRFGGHQALTTVSLGADPGQVTGLIGPNGAGKTTLFNVITGLQDPTAGAVVLDGRDLTRAAPFKRARAGLARTFQRLELFPLLTVRENVRVAADLRRRYTRSRGIDTEATADRALERVGLGGYGDAAVGELPTGQARLVELARALASEPRVLLLDEPASGQTEQETEEFARLLGVLSDEGMAIVLVEHDVPLVMSTCATIHVLDFGQIIATGTPDEIRQDRRVLDAYLGATGGIG